MSYSCSECGKEFDTRVSLGGHVGGAHSRKRVLKPIDHGTLSGYAMHIRRKVPHDECKGRCLTAYKEYSARRRERLRESVV